LSDDFRLGSSIVRPQRRLVERDGESVHVKPKSMSVLACLVAAAGKPVSRNELFDKVWPGGEVSDDTLTQCIVELRRAFGDSARESRIIETIPRLGFRLVPKVEPLEQEPTLAENRQPHRNPSRRPRFVSLLLVGAVLVLATSLAFPGPRLWLTETGITWLIKTAGMLAPSSLEPIPGIAVLPFVNISGDPENEYFSDGVAAEVRNSLARKTRLPVISRSSSFQFKGQNRDIREIGSALGVSHVLEGSVRKAGKDIRMTVHLIDVATGAQIWAGAYQRQLKDVFSLQSAIAEEIVDNVGAVLGDSMVRSTSEFTPAEGMAMRHTANLEAHDLYLKGVRMLRSGRPALIEQAAVYFDRAIALDGDYADAWAAKGGALANLGWVGSGSSRIPASVYPDAIAALRRALEIEPGHALAMGLLGMALMANDFKWEEGMQLLKDAVARNPNDATLLSVYGFYMNVMHMEGAGEVLEKAFRLDPLNFETIMNRAIYLQRQGRLADAAALLETTLIEDPEGYASNYFSAIYNVEIGRLDAAEERLRKAQLVANPGDVNLEALQWLIDSRRGKTPFPCALAWERMQTQHLGGAVLSDECSDEKAIVDVFDLAIKQRHPELRSVLFGPKPELMPEAEWLRIREITGVTQFQSAQ